jgi:hypothetical protein
MVDIDEIQADRAVYDTRLARLRLAERNVPILQNVRTTELQELNRSNHATLTHC